MKKIIIILSMFIFISYLNLNSQTNDSTYTKNCIYAEGTTILLVSGLSICYERMINSNLSVKVGFCLAYTVLDEKIEFDYGETTKTIMLNYLTLGSKKFEFGFGTTSFGNDSRFYPTIALGYRYQPVNSGIMYRLGLNWYIPLYIPMLQLSLGYAF